MKFQNPSYPKAFTLVETMLAIGVLAIALTGIGGALVAGMEASRTNDRDTMIVTMAENVVSELRLVPFDALAVEDPLVATHSGAAPTVMNAASTPADSIFYFNGDGRRVSADQRQVDGVYRCTVRKVPVAAGSGTMQPGSRCELLRLTLIFQWPASGPESRTTTKVISTQMARR